MKAKTLIACAIVSAASITPALAQNAQPGGPQGTGWYGAPNMAVPVPRDATGPYIPGTAELVPYAEPQAYDSASAGATVVQPNPAYGRNDPRQPMPRRWVYQGFSADTNPPVPAP